MSTEQENRVAEKVYAGTGFYVALILGLILAVALIVFIAQNTDDVAVQWLGFDFEAPLVVVVLVAVLVAIVLDEVVGWLWRKSRRQAMTERAELGRLRREARTATAEEPAAPPTEAGPAQEDVPGPQEPEDQERGSSPF